MALQKGIVKIFLFAQKAGTNILNPSTTVKQTLMPSLGGWWQLTIDPREWQGVIKTQPCKYLFSVAPLSFHLNGIPFVDGTEMVVKWLSVGFSEFQFIVANVFFRAFEFSPSCCSAYFFANVFMTACTMRAKYKAKAELKVPVLVVNVWSCVHLWASFRLHTSVCYTWYRFTAGNNTGCMGHSRLRLSPACMF